MSSDTTKLNTDYVNRAIERRESTELRVMNNKNETRKISEKEVDNTLNKFINETEIQEKFDKSCQTTKELILPMLDQELRRRKAYGITENDEMFDLLNNINDSFDVKPESHRELIKNTSNFVRLQNYIIPEVKLSSTKLQEGTENSKLVHSYTLPGIKSIDVKNKKINKSYKIRQSFKQLVPKKLFKDFRKYSESSLSISSSIETDDFSNSNESFESIDKDLESNYSKELNKVKKNPFLTKITEVVEEKISNQSFIDDHDENENLLSKSNNQASQLEYDSSISSSFSNLNLNDFYNLDKIDSNFNLIIEENSFNSADIENDFMFTLDKEDESMEKFKKILTRDKNLILNWDYVQSSDYL